MQGSLVGAGAPPCSVAAGWRPRAPGGLGLVGQGAGELLDALGVVAAVAAEGAPVGQAALAGPAGDRLGRDVQPAGDLGAGQPGAGCGHAEFTSSRGAGTGTGGAPRPPPGVPVGGEPVGVGHGQGDLAVAADELAPT